MKPLLQQLENESLLLLYLAGELPVEDRNELEVMLQRDGGLRAQLESLRSAQDCSFAAMAAVDAAEPLHSVEPAMRRINRSMQQWWVDQLARPQEPAAARSMIPVIGWSVGTAVAALLVFCIWWGFRTDGPHIVAVTQPSNLAPAGDGSMASGNRPQVTPELPPVASAQAPAAADPLQNAGANASPDPNAVEIVTIDAPAQHLADLEASVSEDLSLARQ
jgi:anti-sigma factor RsiW